ncbi:hypothetical protein CWI66_07445 [Halomonas sp. 141]|nr:hypothetical protein CWI66_07445 [Halomonas sp. 141]
MLRGCAIAYAALRFILHPSPFTLHPSPFTLHPSSLKADLNDQTSRRCRFRSSGVPSLPRCRRSAAR